MKIRAKLLFGFFTILVGSGVLAFVREQKLQAAVESVRASLAVGDSKEKVEQVMHEHGLRPVVSDGGRSYVAHVHYLFHPDVSVIVLLSGHWQVGFVVVKERI